MNIVYLPISIDLHPTVWELLRQYDFLYYETGNFISASHFDELKWEISNKPYELEQKRLIEKTVLKLRAN